MMKLAKSLMASILTVLLVCTMCFSAFAYNDVPMEDEAMPYIEFVDRLGILPSTWNNDFQPEQYLSRADAVVAVYKMLYGADIDPSLYEDVTIDFVVSGDSGDIEQTSVLRAYLAWAKDNYLITTELEEPLFKPADPITANEFMTLLAKILRLVKDPNTATYPDSYTDAVADLVGDIEAGDGPVTRKQAAIALANAIMSSEGTLNELGVYTSFEGEPLDSLAVKVFHMSSVDLIIRATTGRTLGYDVKNGTLLSNGADVDLGEDLSDYVGYGIAVTYRDGDNSGTYTEDEEVLTYSIGSTVSATVPLDDLSIASGNSISVTSGSASFQIGSSTFMYLNDDPWPIGDDKYDLVTMVSAIGKTTSITNRSNLRFKCMAANSDSKYLATVFATESKPGKIVGINKGYYSVYDYYYAGTSKEIKTYHISDCTFSNPVKVGDFINFYESAGKLYCNPGTTKLSGVKDNENGVYTLVDDSELKEHMFFRPGDVILQKSENAENAIEYQFIVDDAGGTLVYTWENYKTNYRQMIIESISSSGNIHNITAKSLKSGETASFAVSYDNVDSTTALAVGDLIDVSDNDAEAPVIYVKKTASKTLSVSDMGDYFMDTVSGQKYYKNAYYMGNLGSGGDFTSGTAKLNLDMANCVISIVY